MNEWHNYVKRFYRLPPHEQQRAWSQLTPEQQSAFRAAYERAFPSDPSTSAQPDTGKTYTEDAEADDWQNYIRLFYRLSPNRQQGAWARLTPEQQRAFRAASETPFRSDHDTSAQLDTGMTYGEVAEAQAAARKKRVRYVGLAAVIAVAAIIFLPLAFTGSGSTRSDYSYRPPRGYTSAEPRSPTRGEFVPLGRALVRSGATGCGSYSVVSKKGSDRAPEYTIRCDSGYWLVWPAIEKAQGPFDSLGEVP